MDNRLGVDQVVMRVVAGFELDIRLPTLVVEIAEEVGDTMIEGVLHGGSDIALMLCAPIRSDIDAKLLRRDPPIAVVHPDHVLAGKASVTIGALAKHTLVSRPRQFEKGST